jgi:hypothetical protein
VFYFFLIKYCVSKSFISFLCLQKKVNFLYYKNLVARVIQIWKVWRPLSLGNITSVRPSLCLRSFYQEHVVTWEFLLTIWWAKSYQFASTTLRSHSPTPTKLTFVFYSSSTNQVEKKTIHTELIRWMSYVMYFLFIQYEFFRNFLTKRNIVIREWSFLYIQNFNNNTH